jgi:hypothetical protein
MHLLGWGLRVIVREEVLGWVGSFSSVWCRCQVVRRLVFRRFLEICRDIIYSRNLTDFVSFDQCSWKLSSAPTSVRCWVRPFQCVIEFNELARCFVGLKNKHSHLVFCYDGEARGVYVKGEVRCVHVMSKEELGTPTSFPPMQLSHVKCCL